MGEMGVLCKAVGILMVAFFCVSLTWGQETAASIIQKSVEANDRDWAAAPQFDWTERDRTKDGDKTSTVTMLLGSPYYRLIAIDGRPLDSEKRAEEQKKFVQTKAEREQESPDKRAERIAKYEKDRKRDHAMMQQLVAAFDFKLLGHRTFMGHRVYVLSATPRKGYQPPDRVSQVLTGMEGKLWIDRDTFQWVRVEAEVMHPVKIEGFLAEVERGTRFELEKTPVTKEIWLAKHFSERANAKVMMLVPHKSQEDDTFSDYHKAATEEHESHARNRQDASTPLDAGIGQSQSGSESRFHLK
jgi:hypothetical protein